MIDEDELRDFIRTKKREGILRLDVDHGIAHLFEKYDPNGNGVLDQLEWTQLQKDLVVERKDPIATMQALLEAIDGRTRAQEERIDAMSSGVDRRLEALEEKMNFIAERLVDMLR